MVAARCICVFLRNHHPGMLVQGIMEMSHTTPGGQITPSYTAATESIEQVRSIEDKRKAGSPMDIRNECLLSVFLNPQTASSMIKLV